MQWFRFYNEFAFDPKIQTMSETFQRRFVMLLCLQSNNDLQKLTEEEIAFALRITPEELQKSKETFIQKCFINEDWRVLNWDKRQYVSDNSTERVRRFRGKQKETQDETFQKQDETVTVTPPEQNRTDTEQNRKEHKKSNSFTSPTIDEVKTYCKQRNNHIDAETFIDFYTAKGWVVGRTKMKDWKAAIRTWEKRDIKPGYKDPYANSL